jgi:hypothetical protein
MKYKNETEFLGSYLTEDVKWDVHIKHLCNILNTNYHVVQSLQTITSINTLRSIHFANFYSHLRYGILFLREVIHKVQKYLNCKRRV